MRLNGWHAIELLSTLNHPPAAARLQTFGIIGPHWMVQTVFKTNL
jgi:hypothetical protein